MSASARAQAAPRSQILRAPAATESARWASRERAATIIRDTWGVPHVRGREDADAAFALLYAQCEDDVRAVERALLSAQGRTAELDGNGAVEGDALLRAFRVPTLSRAEWTRTEPRVRALLLGAADGYNDYVSRHSGSTRRLSRVEPWMFLALDRAGLVERVFDDDLGPIRLDLIGASLTGRVVGPGRVTNVPAHPASEPDGVGSNAVVLGPARSASGHPLVFINPHGGWFGTHVVEAEVQSGEGWHVAGTVLAGGPVIALGHTESFAWTHTNAMPRVADAWVEHFDRHGDRRSYHYGTDYRRAVEWRDTLRIEQPDGTLRDSVLVFRATHHGPVLVARGDSGWSVRVAGVEEGGAIAQWYAMSRAHSFAEFRTAMQRLALPTLHTMYADTTGRIWYLYGGTRVPRRDPRFDWTQPVDGADPGTEWRGRHRFSELPQLLDPSQGYVANANSSPFQLAGGALSAGDYPRYMVREETDFGPEQGAAYSWTWRAERMREILGSRRRYSVDEFQSAMLDTRWIAFRRPVAVLSAAWDSLERADPARAATLREPVLALRAWNLEVDSTTDVAILAYRWARAANAMIGGRLYVGVALDVPTSDTVLARLRPVALPALERAVAQLDTEYGTWRVPHGRVVRLQRPPNDDPARFDASRPSVASPGAQLGFGALFAAWTDTPTARTRFVTGGNSYVAVIEVGPEIMTRSIVWFGASADSTSPHYLDQLPLFATKRMKPAWFGAGQLRGHVEREYHPGSEPVR